MSSAGETSGQLPFVSAPPGVRQFERARFRGRFQVQRDLCEKCAPQRLFAFDAAICVSTAPSGVATSERLVRRR